MCPVAWVVHCPRGSEEPSLISLMSEAHILVNLKISFSEGYEPKPPDHTGGTGRAERETVKRVPDRPEETPRVVRSNFQQASKARATGTRRLTIEEFDPGSD